MNDHDTGAADRRKWLGLAVLALPALLLAIDLSVLSLALPRLSEDLSATSTEQLWISDIYGFLVSGFLITAGRLGDRIGRRKLLFIGAFGFAVASALAAFSTTVWMLIAARALMGVAGATLAPSTLALISNIFTDTKQRAVGVAVYVSCFMGGAAFGPVVGGLMLQSFWWGSVFLLGVPVMVLLLAAGPFLLPEFRDENASTLDPLSVVLSLGAVLPIIYGIKESVRTGLSVVPILSIVVGVVLGALFIRRQSRLTDPLLDLTLFRKPAFSAALVVLLFAVGTQGGVMLLTNLDLQVVQGLSPLSAGLWGIAPAMGMVVGSMAAPALAQKVQPGTVITAGLIIAAVGYATMTQTPVNGLGLLIGGATVVFFGIGLVGALANNVVLGAVPPERAGSAAAIVQTSGDLGIALGIAVLGSVGTGWYARQLTAGGDVPAEALDKARASITDAAVVAGSLPDPAGRTLMEAARVAFTDGLHLTALVSAVLVLGLAVLAVLALRERATAPDAPAEKRSTLSH
ncbi:MFS transporter [Dactylosporangium siamense]|uniref:MFS transporter n=1 Tax=Dactylosporangium siamense TaxID=685454 RepID=A0A919PRU6_9ACTN|nr:MFS transporter [Dactylosporangium siamense]GIG47193.1 MFS transporter [Dactylosporangium siamense]